MICQTVWWFDVIRQSPWTAAMPRTKTLIHLSWGGKPSRWISSHGSRLLRNNKEDENRFLNKWLFKMPSTVTNCAWISLAWDQDKPSNSGIYLQVPSRAVTASTQSPSLEPLFCLSAVSCRRKMAVQHGGPWSLYRCDKVKFCSANNTVILSVRWLYNTQKTLLSIFSDII